MPTPAGSADSAIDTFATTEEQEHIPGDLSAKVAEFHEYLRQVHVEFKSEQGRWATTKKKISWPEAPTVDSEAICLWVVQRAREHAERDGGEVYRAVLTLLDPHSQKRARKYCPLTTAVSPSGDMEIVDDPRTEFTQRDHLELLHKIVERSDAREDAVFTRYLDLVDKMNETLDRNITMAEKQAAGVAAVGDSLGKIVKASTGALDNAMKLFDRKDHETTQIQLAKIDQQTKQQQVQFALKMLEKIGGPLMKQLSSLFGSGDKPKVTQGTNEAKAVEGSSDPALEAAKLTPQEILDGLIAWRNVLSDEQRKALAEILGAFEGDHYAALNNAATPDEAVAALAALKAACEKLEDTEEGTLELLSRLAAINTVLGDELANQFGELLP